MDLGTDAHRLLGGYWLLLGKYGSIARPSKSWFLYRHTKVGSVDWEARTALERDLPPPAIMPLMERTDLGIYYWLGQASISTGCLPEEEKSGGNTRHLNVQCFHWCRKSWGFPVSLTRNQNRGWACCGHPWHHKMALGQVKKA